MRTIRSGLRWCFDQRLPTAVAASGLAVLVLLGGPLLIGQRPTYRFLLWNLALAWVPFVAGLIMESLDGGRHRVLLTATAVAWLLFLPNAAYLVSDLTHFDPVSATPWLDLARLVAFAWAGCLLAVLSMRSVHRIVTRHAGAIAGWCLVIASSAASGAGVALGRFGRVNSWEVVTSPATVATTALRLGGSPQALAIGGFFTLLVLVVYVAVERSPFSLQ